MRLLIFTLSAILRLRLIFAAMINGRGVWPATLSKVDATQSRALSPRIGAGGAALAASVIRSFAR